jgi:hypothetical protein
MSTSIPKELHGARVQRFPLVGALEVRTREIRMKDGKRVLVAALWERGQQQGKLSIPVASWRGFVRALRSIDVRPPKPARVQQGEDADEATPGAA